MNGRMNFLAFIVKDKTLKSVSWLTTCVTLHCTLLNRTKSRTFQRTNYFGFQKLGFRREILPKKTCIFLDYFGKQTLLTGLQNEDLQYILWKLDLDYNQNRDFAWKDPKKRNQVPGLSIFYRPGSGCCTVAIQIACFSYGNSLMKQNQYKWRM